VVLLAAMSKTSPKAAYQLQTVSRALDTLRLLEETAASLSQTEIAEALDEPVPVVFRILHTLEGRGFVRRGRDKRYVSRGTVEPEGLGRPLDILRQLSDAAGAGARSDEIAARLGLDVRLVDEALAVLALRKLAAVSDDGKWTLGFGLIELARPLLRGTLRSAVRPLMERLRDESGETATLFVTSGDQQVVLDIAASRQPLRYELEIGAAFALHRGAAGKAALSAMEDADVKRILESSDLKSAERRRVLADVMDARRRGFATSLGERLPGGAAVAAPIRDESGRAVGVLGLMLPAFRNEPDRLPHLGKVLAGHLAQLVLPDTLAPAHS
jgi:IclR family acetate operon transcriptional repressor